MPQPDETLFAADGGRLFPTANTLADFVRMVEDGQFDADVTTALRDLAAKMEDLFAVQGNKIAAKLTMTFDIQRDPDGFYRIGGDFTVKEPKQNRKRSLAWLTTDNLFTPNMPNQGQMFGTVREVPASSRTIRN